MRPLSDITDASNNIDSRGIIRLTTDVGRCGKVRRYCRLHDDTAHRKSISRASAISSAIAPSDTRCTKISSTYNLKTSNLFTRSINCFFIARKSSLKWLFFGKYRTVVPRYLWYCDTTVIPWPRQYWYYEKEVPRFHGEYRGTAQHYYSPGISPGAAAPLLKICSITLAKTWRSCSAANGFSGLIVHEEIHLVDS